MRMTTKISRAMTLALLIGTATLVTYTNASTRVMNMRNLCRNPVWFGFAGGSCRNRQTPTDTKCGSDADCFEGTKCIVTGPFSQCFFVNPSPADGQFKLD